VIVCNLQSEHIGKLRKGSKKARQIIRWIRKNRPLETLFVIIQEKTNDRIRKDFSIIFYPDPNWRAKL
jgi:hypothetical protein